MTHSSPTSRPEYLIRYALRLLGRRSYPTAAMRQKLQNRATLQRKLESEVALPPIDIDVEDVLSYLREHRLLDDRAYSTSLVESLQRRHKSARYIEQKLQQTGLSASESAGPDASADLDHIRTLVNRKLIYEPALLSNEKKRSKLILSLQRRGFRYSDIRSVLTELSPS